MAMQEMGELEGSDSFRITGARNSVCDDTWWLFFFSSRRRHTRFDCDWSSDVCSSDLGPQCLSRLAAISEQAREMALDLHLRMVSSLGKRAASSQHCRSNFRVVTDGLGQCRCRKPFQLRMQRVGKNQSRSLEQSRHHSAERVSRRDTRFV